MLPNHKNLKAATKSSQCKDKDFKNRYFDLFVTCGMKLKINQEVKM